MNTGPNLLGGHNPPTPSKSLPETWSAELAQGMDILDIGNHEVNPRATPSDPLQSQQHEPPHLLNLVLGVRLKILRELLSLNETTTIQRQWKENGVDQYFNREQPPRRPSEISRLAFMLSNGQQTMVKANLSVSVLRCCKQLYNEGRSILRYENRFFGVTGMEDYGPIEYPIGILGQVPTWRMFQMTQLYGTSSKKTLPAINMALQIFNPETMSRQGSASYFDMHLFPLCCVGLVCKAISYLPMVPRVVHLPDPFPPRYRLWVNDLDHVFRASGHFIKTQSQTLIESLGKSVVDVTLHSRGGPSLNYLVQPLPFVDNINLQNTEPPQAALKRALARLVDEWNEGERLATEANDPTSARDHFSNMKQMIILIDRDAYWNSLISNRIVDRLSDAGRWACHRIITLPITNEALHMQVATAPRAAQLEARWVLEHLADMKPPSRVGPGGYERYARVSLRRAELGFIVKRPMWENARDLVHASCFLAPIAMYTGIVTVDSSPAICFGAARFLWCSKTHEPTQLDIDRLTGVVEDGDFWQRSWIRMRNGRTRDDQILDRECFLRKWKKVKELLAERFGKVGRCPMDPEMLLEGF